MEQSTWESDKMLDVYIYDYLWKRKLHASAEAFKAEANVPSDHTPAINTHGGFLFEWWTVFWDIFIARIDEKHSESAAAYIEAQRMMTREQQHQMQQLQLAQQRNGQLLYRDPSHHPATLNAMNSEGMQGQTSDNVLATKMHEERMKDPPAMKSEASPAILDPNTMALLKSAPSNQDQLIRSNSGNASAALQHIQSRTPLSTGNPCLAQPNYLLASQQQQKVLSFGDKDHRSFIAMARVNMNSKDGQSTRNDGSISSQVHSGSPKVEMSPMQQTSAKQHEPLQQQQLHQSNRKRKQRSSSEPAADSNGTGNTVDPSPNSPPSTQNPGDGITTASSTQQANSVPKITMVNGSEGAGGLASFASLPETTDRFGEGGSNPGGQESSKGFTFSEVGCIRRRKDIVTSCHFSTDGNLLASAGHDKKLYIWNMVTLRKTSTPEEHESVITDVRFRPNSSQLLTASVDQSVRLWDAANLGHSLQKYTGHRSAVMSLDFHPKKTDLFCFCDHDNQIHYFDLNSFSCTRISKGGTAKVRFQPINGHLLAAASDKVVSLFDVETDAQVLSLQGHSDLLNYICWNASEDYLASVSQNMVNLWCIRTGSCVRSFSSNGNQFHSCVFHPRHPNLLVVGGASSIELWNVFANRSMSIRAHENIISAFAQSKVAGMVASASHDTTVKLWK